MYGNNKQKYLAKYKKNLYRTNSLYFLQTGFIFYYLCDGCNLPTHLIDQNLTGPLTRCYLFVDLLNNVTCLVVAFNQSFEKRFYLFCAHMRRQYRHIGVA
jgi:hypothetical protein